jgi:hypothetical protein
VGATRKKKNHCHRRLENHRNRDGDDDDDDDDERSRRPSIVTPDVKERLNQRIRDNRRNRTDKTACEMSGVKQEWLQSQLKHFILVESGKVLLFGADAINRICLCSV